MVKVYFEKNGKAKLAAVFCNIGMYNLCYERLEKEADVCDYILTESVEEDIELSDLIK